MIFDNHKHEWNKWNITHRGDLGRTNYTTGIEHIAGRFLYQERTCKTCGKTEIDKQQVEV